MAQSTRPGNVERGWNDPPEFLHTGNAPPPAPSQRRTLLNKRVPFPGMVAGSGVGVEKTCTDPKSSGGGTLPPPKPGSGIVHCKSTEHSSPSSVSSAACTSTNTPPQGLGSSDGPVTASLPADAQPTASGVILFPPASSTDIPKFTAPIIVPAMSPKEESPLSNVVTIATNPVNNARVNTESGDKELGIPDFDNDEQMFHFVLTRLQKTCVDCAHVVKPRVIDDINRKLEIFSKMWQNNKISYPVKSSMAQLATALHKRKCDVAHKIHLALMMDFVSEVGQWMVGIKRLIHEARGIDPPTSPTDTTVLPPDVSNTDDTLAKLGLASDGTIPDPDSSNDNTNNDITESGTTENTAASTDPDCTQPPSGSEKDNSTHNSIDSGPAIIETTPITD